MPTTAKGESVAGDVIKDVLRFPLWWYTTGVAYTVQRLTKSVQGTARMLSIGVWFRNLFVPMYGYNDWQSRIISFIVRSGQIFVRGIGLLVWIGICFVQFIVYLALPIAAVIMIFASLYAATA